MGINDFLQVGSRIKSERMKAGYSQKKMATMLHLSPSTYSNYENNYREPPIEIIDQICDILKINRMDLIIPETSFDERDQQDTSAAEIDFRDFLYNKIDILEEKKTQLELNLNYIKQESSEEKKRELEISILRLDSELNDLETVRLFYSGEDKWLLSELANIIPKLNEIGKMEALVQFKRIASTEAYTARITKGDIEAYFDRLTSTEGWKKFSLKNSK